MPLRSIWRLTIFDDPTIQLARYVSHDLSSINHSGSTDRFLDALYIGQAMSTNPRQRARMMRDFERHALTAAYAVPFLWWNRILVTSRKFKGWNITPSQYIGEDLADVWQMTHRYWEQDSPPTSKASDQGAPNRCCLGSKQLSRGPPITISLVAADPRRCLHRVVVFAVAAPGRSGCCQPSYASAPPDAPTPIEMMQSPVFWTMYIMFVLVGVGGLISSGSREPDFSTKYRDLRPENPPDLVESVT